MAAADTKLTIGTIVGFVTSCAGLIAELKGLGLPISPLYIIYGGVAVTSLTLLLHKKEVEALTRPWRPSNAVLIGVLNLVCLVAAIAYVRVAGTGIVAATTSQQSALASELRRLAALHTTEYVGVFPSNMGTINRLISETRRQLTIAVDFAAYGSYSNPAAHYQYKSAIVELLQKKIPVNLYVYNARLARDASAKQFAKDDWEEMRGSETFKTFVSFYQSGNVPQAKRELYDRFQQLDSAFVRELKMFGAHVSYVARELPAYSWISDNERAIFSFYNLAGDISEVSFSTTDGSLIEVLTNLNRQIPRSEEDQSLQPAVLQTSSAAPSRSRFTPEP